MFRVSYLSGKYNDRRYKDFSAYATAQLYFLQKFHEDRPGLQLSVIFEESIERIETEREDE